MTTGIFTKAMPAALSIYLLGTATAIGQWSNAARLNDAAHIECKTPRIAGSKYGGFHVVYSAGAARYCRYSGSPQPIRTIFTEMNFNNWVAEALNGDVHVAFENWAGSNAPNIGWSRSTDGGVTFSPVVNISASSGCAKHPHLAAFGTGTSADVVMSYYRSGTTGNCNKQLYYTRFNGSSWSAESSIGSTSLSEYDCFGMARSPLNGSIYRSFDPNQTSMRMRQYMGSWGAEIPLVSGMWPVRQHIAINDSGQVMLMWDSDSQIYSMLYTPGVGPGPMKLVSTGGYSGSCNVCAIPGTNKFYMVVGKDTNRVVGRRWIGDNWLAEEESVSAGLAGAFTVDPAVACDSAGALYCVWEYWGNDKPQIYYSTLTTPSIVRTRTQFNRIGYVNGRVSDDTFLISNGGAGTLNYTITSNAAWVAPVPASGSATRAQDNNITLRYNLAGLVPGSYNATITIAAAGASNSPKTILVSLQVLPLKQDFDGDGDVDLDDFSRFQSCFNGPNRAPPAVGGCSAADFDGDADVDLDDFSTFQMCYNGPNRVPACM